MSQCTAPVRGHIWGGGADCPVHGRGGGYGYGYSTPSYPRYSPPPVTSAVRSGSSTSSGGRTARPSWSPRTSTVSYTPQQVRDLEPVRTAVVVRTQAHDVFLCHAWPDRQADAKDAYDLNCLLHAAAGARPRASAHGGRGPNAGARRVPLPRLARPSGRRERCLR